MGTPHPAADAPSSSLALPDLTAKEIASLTDSGSFSRGRDYRRRGAIRQPNRRGRMLTALCVGSEPSPYQVRATLADPSQGGSKVVDYSCTCLRGGFCKHIVALLLTWVEVREVFEVRQTTDELLSDLTRDDLVRLIHRMVEHDPSLAMLIDRLKPPPPITPAGPGEARLGTLNLAAFRSKITQVIDEVTARERVDHYDEWGGYSDDESEYEDVVNKLREVTAHGVELLTAGRLADAVIVFAVVSEQAASYAADYDGDAEFTILIDCGLGLLDCLERQKTLPIDDRLNPSDRAVLVDSLFNCWSHTGAWGWSEDDPGEDDESSASLAPWRLLSGLGPRDAEAAIVAALTDKEQSRFEVSVRKQLSAPEPGQDHKKHQAIRFLSKLRPDAFRGADALIDAYKEAGLWQDVANELLGKGRVDEAVTLIRPNVRTAHEIVTFAGQLVALGGQTAIRGIQLVADRLWETEGNNPHNDLVFVDWLSTNCTKFGMVKEAFEMERRRFKQAPALRSYLSLKDAATADGMDVDLWEKTRQQTVADLTKRRQWGLLIQIHLHEHEIKEAIAALEASERSGERIEQPIAGIPHAWMYTGMPASGYREHVAKAAEDEFPDVSIQLYRSMAEVIIQNRDRHSYTVATGYIAAIRSVMERTGRETEWREYITTLREEHKRLRALKEELDLAGLT